MSKREVRKCDRCKRESTEEDMRNGFRWWGTFEYIGCTWDVCMRCGDHIRTVIQTKGAK
ncbi:MAG: hypothetical protein ACYTBJ_02155 [Planctomycetota bacterium]